MNSHLYVFDPSLSLEYSQRYKNKIKQKDNFIESRQLFYWLNQPEQEHKIQPIAYDFIIQQLKETKRVNGVLFSQRYSEKTLASLQTLAIAPLPKDYQTQTNLVNYIKQTAGIQFTQPCWLQTMTQSAFCQSKIAVKLTSIYLQLIQRNQKNPDLQTLFYSLLLTMDYKIPLQYSYSYSQSEVMSTMFDFSTTQLALAHFPRVLFPEILGFTLAYCQMPTLIEVCFPNHQLPSSFFQLRHNQLKKQQAPLLNCITDYLNSFPKKQQILWLRVQSGFWLYQLQMQYCRDQFNDALEQPLSSQQAITQLFQKKAMAAIGHHQKIILQGISLDKWFSGMPENSHNFLQALLQSNYIDKQKPTNSPLLKLFTFNGPMFGILDKIELNILTHWIEDGLINEPIAIKNKLDKTDVSERLPVTYYSSDNYKRLNNRGLYYYLVNADLFPDVLPIAQHKANQLLRICSVFNLPPFKHYNHKRLDTFIENIYQHEINAYSPLQGHPKISRKAYIWGLEQMAPMILIDGCWLQNSQTLQAINPEISEILFSIYCDEIGNSQLEQNHPYIFQQLLDSLSIKVPPVYSPKFIEHSEFIDSAFDLPVYMLSLSHFPVEFLPELLGLNMAIELSGLGKSYLNLIDDWNYWGIDPTIATIHVSIDNYVSGHTFLAKKAIQLYMDNMIQRTGNHTLLDKHWYRIYNGYASLRFAGGLFKAGLPIWYLTQKFKQMF